MPGKLRQYYQIVGGVKSLNRCFNRLYSPNKLDDEGGYRIFMEENQNVVVWAFKLEDAEADNPMIYQACCLENGDLGKWFPSAEPCDDWLVSMVYWQVVNGGFQFGAYADCSRDLRRRLAARWPLVVEVPDQGPMLFYGRKGQLLCWCGKKHGSLYAVGRTREDLQQIHKALAIDWDYSALDD